MAINTIYLDMDGVIADFRKGCEKLDAINGTTVDWKKIHEMGPKFWSELEWVEKGQDFYKWLVKFCKQSNIDLCILSAVNYEDGVTGKKEWLRTNCPEISSQNMYFVSVGRLKQRYANDSALLIDDFGKNIEKFVMANGQGIVYKDPAKVKEELLGMI